MAAEKPDVVVELSQEGHDVTETGDENMIWSSRWPSIKTAREFVFDIAAQNVAQDYAHNWGESTAFFVYTVGATASRPNVYSQLRLTDTLLRWIPTGGEPATPLKLKCFVTDIKLEQNFLAEIFSTGGEPSIINRSQVVALSKEGKDVTSDDLRDFVFHSYCRSPMLHQVVNTTTAAVSSGPGVNGVDAVHGLPYTPMHFAYKKTASGWQHVVGIGGTEGVFVMADRIRYGNSLAGVEVSLVVWKDPFNLGAVANVIQ